jgi:hypothetical protein
MRVVQVVLFTTKITKHTKGSEKLNSELRALRVLRGESIFTLNLEEPLLPVSAQKIDEPRSAYSTLQRGDRAQ